MEKVADAELEQIIEAAGALEDRLPLSIAMREIWTASRPFEVDGETENYSSWLATCHSETFGGYAVIACNHAASMARELKELRARLAPVTDEEVAEIRERHERVQSVRPSHLEWDDETGKQAHTDRATLLRLHEQDQEEIGRLREARAGAPTDWLPISEAGPLERIVVAGWQPQSGSVQGYWWWHEDETSEDCLPVDHPNASHFMRPRPAQSLKDSEP